MKAHYNTTILIAAVVTAALHWLPTQCGAFVPTPSLPSSSRMSQRYMTAAESEYQQVKDFLQAMKKQKITSNMLKVEDRADVETYLRKIVQERPTGIPLRKVEDVLPDTAWTLQFSSNTAALGDLPADATVKLEFGNSGTNSLNYVLEFSKKTLGLNRLVAKSSYTVDTTKNINPGLVTFVYEDIVTDVFGLKNIGVGFFGLLKGRSNYIETVFMDNVLWIERGYSPEGNEFYNVYMKQLEEEEEQEESSKTSSATSTVSPTLGLGGGGADQWDD